MKTYIVFLRGINVSGQKKIKMAELRIILEKIGFHDVTTYIQSGNIIVKTTEKNTKVLEDKIRTGILNAFGFEVPVLVKSKGSLENIFNQHPFVQGESFDNNKVYFVLLKQMPEQYLIQAMDKETFLNERFSITKDCVYLLCVKGYGNAKLNNNFLERKLNISATTRNYKTIKKLLELANA